MSAVLLQQSHHLPTLHNRLGQCGLSHHSSVSDSEGLQTGGQREGVVRLPQDPPAPSHRLRHPPV